jgi:signal transduction histidine kinase
LLSDLACRNKTATDEIETHVGKLSNIAREVVRDLDAIVWAVNPKNDFLDNLASYIFQYVEKFLGTTSIRCRMDYLSNLPHCHLSSEARHSLFLVVKEAMNNIVKHSGATEVWLRVKTEGSKLIFAIEDNGKGFDAHSLAEFGNGLGNMETRVQELRGKFDLNSVSNKGTRIRITVPWHHSTRHSNRASLAAAA